jgi:hypothetical protein
MHCIQAMEWAVARPNAIPRTDVNPGDGLDKRADRRICWYFSESCGPTVCTGKRATAREE